MIRSDEHWLATIDAFHSAALGAQSWETALRGFADATGSRSSQLTGIGSDNTVLFNTCTGIDDLINFDSHNFNTFFHSASINPRASVGHEAPALELLADDRTVVPDERRRDPLYHRILQPLDRPFIFLTTLDRQEGTSIVLAAARSQREERITREQREMFAALAPHIRTAVRTHLALERNGTAVLTGAMETLSIPVFVCDRTGQVKALTQPAELLASSGCGLELKCGRLQARHPDAATALNDAIDAAVIGCTRRGPPVLRTVIVREHDDNASPLVLDVFALPAQPYNFNFAPRVLIVARGPRGSNASRAALLHTVYALTPAETDIAQHLAEGKPADFIGLNRGVAVGTVRAQIKRIMAKLGVGRQVELAIRLSQL